MEYNPIGNKVPLKLQLIRVLYELLNLVFNLKTVTLIPELMAYKTYRIN